LKWSNTPRAIEIRKRVQKHTDAAADYERRRNQKADEARRLRAAINERLTPGRDEVLERQLRKIHDEMTQLEALQAGEVFDAAQAQAVLEKLNGLWNLDVSRTPDKIAVLLADIKVLESNKAAALGREDYSAAGAAHDQINMKKLGIATLQTNFFEVTGLVL
jgi:hypothetical protein